MRVINQRDIKLRGAMRSSDCIYRAGWTLTHMALAISLVGIFMLGAARLFSITQGTIRQSQRGITAVHQAQSMVGFLRADVWGAVKLKQVDVTTLQITRPDQSVVTWRFRDATVFRAVEGEVPNDADETNRADGAGARQWPVEADSAAFLVTGPVVTLAFERVDGRSAGALQMTSQVLLTQSMTSQGDAP